MVAVSWFRRERLVEELKERRELFNSHILVELYDRFIKMADDNSYTDEDLLMMARTTTETIGTDSYMTIGILPEIKISGEELFRYINSLTELVKGYVVGPVFPENVTISTKGDKMEKEMRESIINAVYMMNTMMYPYNPDEDNYALTFDIVYDDERGGFVYKLEIKKSYTLVNSAPRYFKSREQAENVVRIIGEDNILKYYFGIEEPNELVDINSELNTDDEYYGYF